MRQIGACTLDCRPLARTIDKLADTRSLSSLLLLGEAAPYLAKQLQHAPPQVVIEDTDTVQRRLTDDSRYALAVLTDALPQLPRPQAAHVLAHLRDVSACYLLVALTSNSAWGQHDMLSLGLSALDSSYRDGTQLYEFNITDYKQRPEWLNAQHWANPERWDAERW